MAERVYVTLVASTGEEHKVEKRIAEISQLVVQMTEDGVAEKVPLLDVKEPVLKKVIDFCTHYAENKMPDIEKPLRSANLADVVPEFYAKFVDVGQEQLFELILAANFMDVKPLLDLSSAKVASMIKGKKVEEIRKLFNIKNDFTPEEEALVKDENRWAEEI